uniref:Uncharacterized protein n=1 Tax=Sander lucioperca TaxID=283035 RepID=A0A8C9XVD6_SANLU
MCGGSGLTVKNLNPYRVVGAYGCYTLSFPLNHSPSLCPGTFFECYQEVNYFSLCTLKGNYRFSTWTICSCFSVFPKD